MFYMFFISYSLDSKAFNNPTLFYLCPDDLNTREDWNKT